jgi:3-deoxy-D-manno-octulosonic-acid transferase
MLALDALYLLIVLLATPWLVWRRIRQGKHRRGWREKLLGLVRPTTANGRPVIWLHAVSVGELNLLPPLLRELAVSQPDASFRITTSTETGFDHAVCPADFSWAVRRAIRRIRPSLLVLMELELWPNLLLECRRQKIPVALVNARMSDRSFGRLVRVPWLARRLLDGVSLVCAQNDRYAKRFARLGVGAERLAVSGNLKFDGANTDRNAPPIIALREKLGLPAGEKIFVAGSTQPGEDVMALDAWLSVRESHPDLRLVVVPRHPHTADGFCRELTTRGLPFVRRSRDERLSPDRSPAVVPGIIVVDIIGELPAWWGLATIGFVGGSFGKRGGQSMIEPAALGVPVCFGPHTWNFRDAVDVLLELRLATVVRDVAELQAFLGSILVRLPRLEAPTGRAPAATFGIRPTAPGLAGILSQRLEQSLPAQAPSRRIA